MHLLTQSAVLRALGWCLFDSFWQMAFLWLLYISFINIFKNASANTRHGLALLLLGSGTVWSLITLLQALFAPTHPGTADWLSDLVLTGINSGTGLLAASRDLLQKTLPWCSFGYLLFLSFLLIRYSGQYLQSRRLKETGLSRIAPEHRLFVEQTSRRMGIRKSVSVWLSAVVDGPVTLGFLKPVILVPIATAGNLTTTQVEAILLHELAHIRRNDYLLNLGVTMLEIFFFFNPFCRWLIRDIKREREHRCDDLVMQFRYDPHDYVSALLSLATNARRQSGPQLALAATGDNDRLLLRRARRILQLPPAQDRQGARPLIFLLCTLLIAGLIGLGLSPWKPGQLDDQHLIGVLPAFNAGRDMTSSSRTRGSAPAHTAGESSATAEPAAASTPAAPKTHIVVMSFTISKSRVASKNAAGIPKRKGSAPAETDNEDAAADMIAVQASGTGHQDAENLGHFAAEVHADKREYSIRTSTAAAPSEPGSASDPDGYQAITPYVPNSSFSYNYIQDSARPDQQFVYLQKLASQNAEIAVKKMQKELQLQLHVLQVTSSKEERDMLLQKKQILQQQLQLQQEYLLRQQALLNRFEKLGAGKKTKIRKIVII